MQADSRRWVVACAVIAFVLVRLISPDLHLCFDGTQPPAALHAAGSSQFLHDSGEAQCRDDLDVDPVGDALSKVAKVDLLAAGPPSTLLLAARSPARVVTAVHLAGAPPEAPGRFVLPPPRAPPV